MDLRRCAAGHFYDADSFSTCPHCAEGDAGRDNGFESGATEKLTEYANAPSETVSLSDLVSDAKAGDDSAQEKTVSFFESAIGAEPVVGWLVCVEGNHFGEDFKLKSGKNFIGRAPSMDVCLSGDSSVSRDKHAVIVYDHNANIFLVQSGESKELAYHNGKLILSPAELKAMDEIQIGATKLVFVPLCGKDFKWDVNKG